MIENVDLKITHEFSNFLKFCETDPTEEEKIKYLLKNHGLNRS